MRLPRWFLAFSALSAACAPDLSDPSPPLWRAEVFAGNYDRLDAVVRAPLPGQETEVRLAEVTEGRSIPVPSQVDDGFLYWILNGETPRGFTRIYHLTAARPTVPAPVSPLRVSDEPGKWIEIELDGRAVLRYNYGRFLPPDGDELSPQTRNAYLHPVWTPAGRVVTDDFHPSHPHQRGIWMAWTKTEFEGRDPDFWNLGAETGTVRFERLLGVAEGPVFAGIRVLHSHVDLTAGGGGKVALKEQWDLRVFGVGGRRWGFHLFEVASSQSCAGDSPLILPEYQYGGMAVRGARDWTPDVVRVLTSLGLGRRDGDGSRADWCLMEGLLGRDEAGLAVFGHPLNFRAPQPLRIHPAMPYFAFSPMRLGPMEIVPGDRYVSRYRFLSYDGSAPPDVIEALWNDYSDPPRVRWSPPDAGDPVIVESSK